MSRKNVIGVFIDKLSVSGHMPNDSDDEKLRKSSLTLMSLPFAAAGLIWGGLYFIYGLYIPGIIPTSYGILSLVSFIYFRKTKKYGFYRTSQIFLILILPFSLQLSLGGFIPSSAVIIWALISPLSAMVFFSTKRSIVWFCVYVVLVIIAYLVNDYLLLFFDWNIDNEFINLVFLLNVLAVSGLIYAIQYYFVGSQASLKKAVEEQAEKLKELDEVKSRFFANISHEFRTPLTLILGLINKQVTSPNELVDKQDSETIQRNASRLLQLINQLLDLSKLESGELKLKTSFGDLTTFSKRMLAMFESMARDKEIQLVFNGVALSDNASFKSMEIYFDQEKLQKVLTNLISNAVKFTPLKGVITINSSVENDQAMIKVSNTGKGIPKAALDHVFDRFYQVDAQSTREYEGTGIGLALVKELVDLHQGKVSVESSSSLTTFSIALPMDSSYLSEQEKTDMPSENTVIDLSFNHVPHEVTKTSKTLASEAGIVNDEESERLEVLVVEDNPDLRGYISSILSKSYKVIQAVDGIDGLEKAESNIPDLIVSDVMMPRMDGYSLCRELKASKNTDHIPLILLTAKASRENKLEGLEIGADDYLIKPFDETELEVRIKNLISIRAQLQKKYQDEFWLKPNMGKIDSVHEMFLAQIKEAIEKNLDNDQFSVDDLGTEIAMSRSQVHRKLKALTDKSATTFIRNYRLHRAAELLKQEVGTITEIAYQVGFSSQTYFSSSFQELFGCAPSEYVGKN